MESGNIVEFIDRQKILCAVVLEVKDHRLRLLTENNREINLSANRLCHQSTERLNTAQSRDNLVETLKAVSRRRHALIEKIDIKELWEVLNSEQEWIDLATMTAFCFPHQPSGDHESAVVRAFFANRVYFKFKNDEFFPNSAAQVERTIAEAADAKRAERFVENAGRWLKSILNGGAPASCEAPADTVALLKSLFLHGKESENYAIGKAVLAKAGLPNSEAIFDVLVKIGEWHPDENIELIRTEAPVEFSSRILERARQVLDLRPHVDTHRRFDLTHLPLMTVDGQNTLDYDDAISIEKCASHHRVGIHIADVGHFIPKGDPIDQEAFSRASSIYMPDQKIPMLPPCLAEYRCSLKAGELRPAISTLIDVADDGQILDYRVMASWVKVKNQLTYYDVNSMAEENPAVVALHGIAQKFRQKRLEADAVQITLPDVNVWVDAEGQPAVTRVNRESPGRMLVAELMIMANWLMADFLHQHQMPTVFRSQPSPRERLYKQNEGNLFQNWMQRKLLSRFILSPSPEHHAGLGLNVYTTATSPIRKYFDLLSQRQIRAVLGLEAPYTADEITEFIAQLQQPMARVAHLQQSRHRYWLLKYLESRVGRREEAMVLYKRRKSYMVLIPEYMIECELPISDSINLKPEDLIQIVIQRVNVRKGVLSVFLG